MARSAKAGADMKNAGSKQDAFALLMSAGRRQQQSSKHQQQKQHNKRSPQSALGASTKRHRSSVSEATQPSQALSGIQETTLDPSQQTPQPQQQQLHGLEAGLSQSAAGSQANPVSKQAAVEAFKRAFSGKHVCPAKQKFDYFLV